MANRIEKQIGMHGSAVGNSIISTLTNNPSYANLLNVELRPYDDDPDATYDSLRNSIFEGRIRYQLPIFGTTAREITDRLKLN